MKRPGVPRSRHTMQEKGGKKKKKNTHTNKKKTPQEELGEREDEIDQSPRLVFNFGGAEIDSFSRVAGRRKN